MLQLVAAQAESASPNRAKALEDLSVAIERRPPFWVDVLRPDSLCRPEVTEFLESYGTDHYISFMRLMFTVGVAVITAATAGVIVLTNALAGPPPQQPFVFGSTHARPIAGKRFTGLTVSFLSNPLTGLDCHARLGDKPLIGRVQRFYENGIPGPGAASCSWLIAKSAAGKTLRAWDRAYFENTDGSGGFWSSGPSEWRVKP